MPLTLPKKIKNYDILNEICEGDRCHIWKIRDEQNIELALKVLKGEERQIFYRDWRIMRELSIDDKLKSHPLVPNIFPIGAEDESGRIFYPLELLGKNIRDITAGKKLGLDEILELMRSISELLADTHAYKKEKPFRINGITHGNLDLSHILKARFSDNWRLIGFRYNPDLQYCEESDKVEYRPSIAPPEFEETKKIDFATDIFQLGALGYELLTGKKIIQHDYKLPSRVKNIPPYIDEIFKRALHENPAERGSMADLNELITETIKKVTKRATDVSIRPADSDSIFEEAKVRIEGGDLKSGLERLHQLILLHPSHIDGTLLLLDYIAENADNINYSNLKQRIKSALSAAEYDQKKDIALRLFKVGASMLLENVDNCDNAIKNALFIWQFATKEGIVPLRIKTEIADLLLLCGYPEKSKRIYEYLLRYKKALEFDVNHIKNNLGISYFKMSKIGKAKRFFEEGDSYAQVNNLGVINMLYERFDIAAELFLKAIEKGREDNKWKIHSNMAIALYCQQNFGAAIYHSLTSTRLRPNANNADAVLFLLQELAKINNDAAKRLDELGAGCQKDFIEKIAIRISNNEFDKVLYLLTSRLE